MGNLALTMDGWTDESMERPPMVTVNLVGGTLIYCEPEAYSAAIPIDDRLKIADGVHPKRVQTLTQTEFRHFKTTLIKSTRVAAIGEIGLDRTVPERDWGDQKLFLETILPTLEPLGKPIILHIRSHRDDKFSVLYFLLLKLVENKLPTNQIFILHCFTGTEEIVTALLNLFLNTYFGFTFLASFKLPQIQATMAIPDNRVLLETDSPYISPEGISVISPIYLGEMVKVVARRRNTTPKELCRQTTENAFTVFGQ